MKSTLQKVLIIGIIVFLIYSLSKDIFFKDDSTQFVNVYSSRKEELTKEIFYKFTKKTGIKVNVLTDDAKKLIKRLEREDYLTDADVFLSSDVGNLQLVSDNNLLEEIDSEILKKNVPDHLRTNQWFALSKRVRAIIYSKERVDYNNLKTYEDLASKRWYKRLLLRSSSNIYNQSLIASMIGKHNATKSAKWIKAMSKNLARPPQGGDTDQINAIASGEGDITVVNSYYLGRMINSDNEEDVNNAKKVGIFFPNQKYSGAHVNISGAGVTKHSKRKENAIKLIEFLTSDEAQKIYSKVNYEYPIRDGIKLSETLENWGEFKGNEKAIKEFTKYNKLAEEIALNNGWN